MAAYACGTIAAGTSVGLKRPQLHARAFPASLSISSGVSSSSAPRFGLASSNRGCVLAPSPAASTSTPTTDAQEAAATERPRRLAIAVDSKEGSKRAVEWVLNHVARPGDVVHLVHVVNNARTPATAVGARGNSSGVQWTGAQTNDQLSKEWTRRLEEAGRTLVTEMFVPLVLEAGLEYELDIVRQRGATSAAGIGELICARVASIGATAAFIASHGAGVLSDFGSVAQYCAKHCSVPVALLPPSALRAAEPPSGAPQEAPAQGSSSARGLAGAAPGAGVMVAAIDDLAGLEQATRFAAAQLCAAGERLTAVSVQNAEGRSADEEDGGGGGGSCQEGESVCEDVGGLQALAGTVRAWADGAVEPDLVDVQALLSVSNTEPNSEHSIVGQQLVAAAAASGARCVVLADTHKNSMMREVMYGNITTYFLRNCKVPIVVLP